MNNNVVLKYFYENKNKYLNELYHFLKIPSISSKPEYLPKIKEAAKWLEKKIKPLVDEVWLEGKYPILIAHKIVDKKLPTVLVYGHYDVQPPEPLELWDSPPFKPEIRNDAIYGRGTCDDKGQLFLHIMALEYFTNKTKKLPCNFKFIIEGEEESASKIISEELENLHKKYDLSADTLLISDTSIASNDCPTVTAGLRGICHFELELTVINKDVHSGVYGGIIPNPIHELSKIISKFHNKKNKINIPNFYDNVKKFSNAERKKINEIKLNKNELVKSLKLIDTLKESGYSLNEAKSIRPCIDFNGIKGGYQGSGSKTIIPSTASAKFSIRLVPNMEWKEVNKMVEKFINENTPSYCKVNLKTATGGNPIIVDINNKYLKKAMISYEKVFNKKTRLKYEGGSIPILSLFRDKLKLEPILMGFGLDSDNIHSPNEHFNLWNFEKGFETLVNFYESINKKD